MLVEQTPVKDCLVLRPVVHGGYGADERGHFAELYQLERYHRAGIICEWVQTNASKSQKNVIRGLHITHFEKLITCLRGSILDVVVDCRNDSPTFGKHVRVYIDAPNVQVYVPAGCAHGFLALEDQSVVIYMQSGMYDPLTERSIRWNDPDLNIPWPHAEEYIVSAKDQKAPLFKSLGGPE